MRVQNGLLARRIFCTNTVTPVNIQIPSHMVLIRNISYEVWHAWTVGGRNWSQSLLRARAPVPEVEGVSARLPRCLNLSRAPHKSMPFLQRNNYDTCNI